MVAAWPRRQDQLAVDDLSDPVLGRIEDILIGGFASLVAHEDKIPDASDGAARENR